MQNLYTKIINLTPEERLLFFKSLPTSLEAKLNAIKGDGEVGYNEMDISKKAEDDTAKLPVSTLAQDIFQLICKRHPELLKHEQLAAEIIDALQQIAYQARETSNDTYCLIYSGVNKVFELILNSLKNLNHTSRFSNENLYAKLNEIKGDGKVGYNEMDMSKKVEDDTAKLPVSTLAQDILRLICARHPELYKHEQLSAEIIDVLQQIAYQARETSNDTYCLIYSGVNKVFELILNSLENSEKPSPCFNMVIETVNKTGIIKHVSRKIDI